MNLFVGRRSRRMGQSATSLLLGLLSSFGLSAMVAVAPAVAAERIDFVYGTLDAPLTVRSLVEFAQTGRVNADLRFYFRVAGATEATRQQLRQALTKSARLSPVLLSRFFYSQIGEDILTRFGNYFQLPTRANGKYALRSALVLAATEAEGLSLLKFLQKLPTDMVVDAKLLLEVSRAFNLVIEATEFFTRQIADLSEQEASAGAAIDFAVLSDLSQNGPYPVQSLRWELQDRQRQRDFYVIVYRPQTWRDGPTPVVVISHGLSSRPEDFEVAATHLASHGYVVAIPQHIGSDTRQTQRLLQGFSREVFLISEFVERPRDVSYTLDELERRNQSEFEGRLNLRSVGVMGHSFGGYAALAVAGAAIDFEQLENDCNQQFGYLNTSLLLQCRALDLPRQSYQFRDRRVQAVFALNPVNSSIFGPKGLALIDIPTLLGAGTYDPATPAIFEQVRSFSWLTTSQKYLAVAEGQAHVNFENLDFGVTELLNSVDSLTLPSPQLLNRYSHSMTLAFFESELVKNSDYRVYMQAAYSKYLSQDQPFKLFLITEKSSVALTNEINQFTRRVRR